MISLKYLERAGWKEAKLFGNRDDVARVRKGLEEKTEDAFRMFDEGKRGDWEEAREKVFLDWGFGYVV